MLCIQGVEFGLDDKVVEAFPMLQVMNTSKFMP